jgi:anti-sigma regulatory factor (Ser/Thr protein kinase)
VVQRWPSTGTHWRASSQIRHASGGRSDGANWTPQVSQMGSTLTATVRKLHFTLTMATVEARGERSTRTLDALPSAVSEARRWAASVTGGLLDHEQAQNLRLIVSELVTNALRHGSDGERIDLAVTPKPEFLCVQVTDDGPGLAPRPRALESEEEGGFGLFFVEQLARRWGVTRENRRTRVWFELDYR